MPKTVLLVEDNEDTRQMMKFALERRDYKVIEASDGYQAVDAALDEMPDLILMDMSLPQMDGLSATKLIRSVEKLSAVPIIVITAHSHSYAEQALEAGCNAVISKPIDFGVLDTFLSEFVY